MKRITLLTALLMTATLGMAQKAFIYNTLQKNGFVSVSAGISQPIGDFSKKTGGQRDGMALRGQSVSVSGGYRLAGPLGLMARYEQTSHGIDPVALLQQYKQSPGDQLTAAPAAGRAGQWQTRSLMAGPYLTIPIGRVALDLRAMAGQVWATCPETYVEGTLNQQELMIKTTSKEAKAISGGLGLTTRYRLTPTVALHVSGDYSSASFTFTDVPVESKMGNLSQQTTVSTKKSLAMATVSVGLTIQFRSRNYVF